MFTRPRLAVALAAIAAIGLLLVADRFVRFDTSPTTLVDPGSGVYQREAVFEDTFGSDPVVMLITGDVKAILGGAGLQQEVNLEGNLLAPANRASGVVSLFGPASIATAAGLAAEGSLLSRLQGVEAAASSRAQADARAAGKPDAEVQAAGQKAAQDAGNAELAADIQQYPELAQVGVPSATNPRWVSAIFLDPSGKPKPRFAAAVPDAGHLVVTARLRRGTGETGAADILSSERLLLRSQPLPHASVLLSGAPALQVAVARALRLALAAGMAVGTIAIVVLLMLGSRGTARRARALPAFAGLATVCVLAGVVAGVGVIFDHLGTSLQGAPGVVRSLVATMNLALNPATLAAFPVALGLAVDYAVQFLLRFRQEVEAGHPQPGIAARIGAGRATGRAAICTAAGLAALLTSGIPMVRQFGVTMMIATAVAWFSARLVVLGTLRGWPSLGRRPATGPRRARVSAGDEEVGLFGLGADPAPVAAAPLEARPGEVGRAAWRLVQASLRRPALVLLPAVGLAAVGWLALPFSPFETDPEQLVSPHLAAFRDLSAVRHATGSGGELDFVLHGPDVTSPAALAWVHDLEAAALSASDGKLKPQASLADLFGEISGGKALTPERARALLSVIPPYFTDALVSRDHSLARITFGTTPGPLAQQAAQLQQVLGDVAPPAGYDYYPAGFAALTMRGIQDLQAGQLWLNLLGAGLVGLVLLGIYRNLATALMAWLPTLLVAGWSAAVLALLRVALTPMTAVLGALVVAFGTEFAILWIERYREATASGVAPGRDAAASASALAGPGIVLSSAALTLGFLALGIGALPMVRNLGFDLPMVSGFGLVAALDIVLAAGAALIVLPAMAVRFTLGSGARPASGEPGAQ